MNASGEVVTLHWKDSEHSSGIQTVERQVDSHDDQTLLWDIWNERGKLPLSRDAVICSNCPFISDWIRFFLPLITFTLWRRVLAPLHL